MGIKPKKQKRKSNETNPEETESHEEPSSKKTKLSPGEDFLNALKGKDGAKALRNWLYSISTDAEKAQMDRDAGASGQRPKKIEESDGTSESNENETNGTHADDDFDVDEQGHGVEGALEQIDSFIDAGGKPSDILKTLPNDPDEAEPSHICNVFRSLAKILLRIAAEYRRNITPAVHACQDFLSLYLSKIDSMLTTKHRSYHRIINLELLTAMVSLHPSLGKSILNTLTLDEEKVEQLTSLNVPFLVRKSYVTFIVALLIDKDSRVIMDILNKPWLITSVFENLQYDMCQTAVLFLTSLQHAIVENMSVSKSVKLGIFHENNVLQLLYLYKWKGPQNRPRSLSYWAMKKQTKKEKPQAEVDEQEVQLVASALHELLLVLLCNHRCGIIFRDTSIGHRGERQNVLISRVLQRIGHPWGNPKVSELVAKILAACPDAMKSTMTSLEPFFAPRSSPKWIHCVNFVKQVLSAQTPVDVLRRQLPNLSMQRLGSAAIEMCIPPAVVRALCSENSAPLYNPDLDLAIHVADLLACMLRGIGKFVEDVHKWSVEGTLTQAEVRAFQRFISEFILKNMPSGMTFRKAWEFWSGKLSNKAEEGAETDNVSPMTVMSLVLECLEIYQRLCPAAMDVLRSKQTSFRSSLTEAFSVTDSSADVARLRVRLCNLLLAIDSQAFNLGNVEVQKPLALAFHDILSPCPTVKKLALSLLQSLISHSGSLEGSPGEVSVWFSVYQEIFCENKEAAKEVVGMLVESLVRASVHSRKYLDLIAQCDEKVAKDVNQMHATSYDSKAIENLFNDILEGGNEGKVCTAHYNTSMSLWLTAFIEVLCENAHSNKKLKRDDQKLMEKFVSKLLLHLLYRMQYPHTLLQMILHDSSFSLPSKLREHLMGWLPSGKPCSVSSKLLGKDSIEVQLTAFLLNEDDDDDAQEDKVHNFFHHLVIPTKENYIEGESEREIVEIALQVTQLFHLVFFHLAQLAAADKLTDVYAHRCQQLLIYLIGLAESADNTLSLSESESYVSGCVKVALSHPVLIEKFSPLTRQKNKSSFHTTDVTVAIVNAVKSFSFLSQLLSPYRHKLLNTITRAARKKKMLKENPVLLVKAFQLSFKEVSQLLDVLSELPPSELFVQKDSDMELSYWCRLGENLFESAAMLRSSRNPVNDDTQVLTPKVVSQASEWFINLLPHPQLDLSQLMKGFLIYLQSCPQQTSCVSKDLFVALLNSKLCSSSGQELAVWLSTHLSQSEVLDHIKSACTAKHNLLEQPNLLLAVLQATLKSHEVPGTPMFKQIYDHLHTTVEECIKSVKNHPQWLAANVDVVVALMKRFMKAATSKQLSKAIENKAPSLTQERLFYMPLVLHVLEELPSQQLLLLLAWLASALKKEDSEGQATVLRKICQAILSCSKRVEGVDLASVRDSHVWQESQRLVLKHALHVPNSKVIKTRSEEDRDDNNDEGSEYENNDVPSVLLKVLSSLVSILYPSPSEHDHISMLHKMTTMHSEFLEVLIGSYPAKKELVNLLHVLVEKNPQITESKHIAVLLAAYNATLGDADRALLRLMQLYEKRGLPLSQYRPYLWGHEGANHYAVWSRDFGANRNLWQQPKADRVLNLLTESMVKATISKYPLHRKLNIENDKSAADGSIYDPSFYIPLFNHLLSPESLVPTRMFVRYGGLPLVLAALSSYDEGMRAAAYNTLARFFSHLQMAKGRDTEVMIQLLNALRLGISNLGEQNPRLSSVTSVFLARCTLEISNPSSLLYSPLSNFLFVKPALNLCTVPEFLALFQSNSVDHIAHRHWILKVLVSGLRSPIDIVRCMDLVVFKLILGYYSCTMADLQTKVLILKVVQSAVQVQYGACCLIRYYNMTSWLHQTIMDLRPQDTTLISEMVQLILKLWNSISLPTTGKKDLETDRCDPHVAHAASKTMYLLLALLPKLKPQMGTSILCKFVQTVSNVVNALTPQETITFIGRKDIVFIISTCSHLIQGSTELYDLLELGCDFVAEVNLANNCADYDVKTMKDSLKFLAMKWLNASKVKS